VKALCDNGGALQDMPGLSNRPRSRADHLRLCAQKTGFETAGYLVNTLKAFFGEAATAGRLGYGLAAQATIKDIRNLAMFEDASSGS